MGILKTYFEKNNTIIKDSLVNTSRNPVTQLFYGYNRELNQNQFSRYIFKFDTSIIEDYITDKTISGSRTHKLKMKNTSSFDQELIAGYYVDISGNMRRSYSFDLILFRIPEDWDAGVGFDYINEVIQTDNNQTYINGPSNWFDRKTGLNWSIEGIYSGTTTIIDTQHFELGNEDIEFDITSEVERIISGDTNNGFGIAFAPRYEQITGSTNLQYVGFYAKDTNTFFEPYIETTWNDLIEDDRRFFFMNKDNRLFFYSYVAGTLVNLDQLPTVTIKDDEDLTISAGTATQLSKGVYYFELNIDQEDCKDKFQYTDTWSNLIFNGKTIPNITKYFTLVDQNEYYNLGEDSVTLPSISVSFTGIREEEDIISGDVRKFMISAKKPFTTNEMSYPVNISYRIYIEEGTEQITAIDWTKMNRGIDNYFMFLDTSWMIPNIYYLDVKYDLGGVVKTYQRMVKFRIVSETRF